MVIHRTLTALGTFVAVCSSLLLTLLGDTKDTDSIAALDDRLLRDIGLARCTPQPPPRAGGLPLTTL
ncbi:DUF1127 domain-containing protein [Methylibium rhizosphaerae]|uniref:DUF1127 domain-containing protein n=1 Tax=Methylibium rhizosphaerae TaxID=2570323 RepID=UPI001127D4C4|nr:DUF1127 domain-containing protein [Methylibium rhizosphaerae]